MAICPHCNNAFNRLRLETVDGNSDGAQHGPGRWTCVVFKCPYCDRVFGAQRDDQAPTIGKSVESVRAGLSETIDTDRQGG